MLQKKVLNAPVLLLGFAILYAYWHSLQHIHRADQWPYLADVMETRGFTETFAHSYSYNRTRVHAPGDTSLFRPLLFGFLALQRAVFGNHFAAWQSVGIILHWLIASMFYFLLLKILQLHSPGVTMGVRRLYINVNSHTLFAFSMALIFALTPSIQELVIWSHLNGYLIFTVLVLICLHSSIHSDRRSTVVWITLLIASFFYEMGQFLAVLWGLYFLMKGCKSGESLSIAMRRFLAFLIIPLVYQITNHIDFNAHRHEFEEDINSPRILRSVVSKQSVHNWGRAFKYMSVQPFFVSETANHYGGERLNVVEMPWSELAAGVQKRPITSVSWLLFVATCALGVGGLVHMWRNQNNTYFLFVCLTLSIYVLYMSIIVFGRMNMRDGPIVLSSNSYYTYIGFLFFLIMLTSVWAVGLTQLRGSVVPLSLGWVIASLLLGVRGGQIVSKTNSMMSHEMETVRTSLNRVSQFISEHRKEDGFSVAFDFQHSTGIPASMNGLPATSILFHSYEDPYRPKYLVAVSNGRVNATPIGSIENPLSPIVPAYVKKVFPSFIIYEWKGEYWAVGFETQYKSLVKGETEGLLHGTDLNAVERQLAKEVDVIQSYFDTRLIRQGYKGFNILRTQGQFFAILQTEGAFSKEKCLAHEYSECYFGKTEKEVLAAIDRKHPETDAVDINIERRN